MHLASAHFIKTNYADADVANACRRRFKPRREATRAVGGR